MASSEEKLKQLKEAGFSDYEINEWKAEKSANLKDAGFSDDEISGYFGEEKSGGYVDKALEGIGKAFEAYDTAVMAPIRSGWGAAQEGENPLSAISEQIGRPGDEAPTMKEIMGRAGVPEGSLSDVFPEMFTEDEGIAKRWGKFMKGGPADITAQGAAGFAGEMATDPLTYLPAGVIAKGGKKGLEGVRKGVNLTRKGVGKAAQVGGRGFAKIGSSLTGIPFNDVLTFIERHDEVIDLVKQSGGDIYEASNRIRKNISSALEAEVAKQGRIIGKALEKANPGDVIPVGEILESMDKVKNRLSPNKYKRERLQIEQMERAIKADAKYETPELNSIDAGLRENGSSLYDLMRAMGFSDDAIPKKVFLDAGEANQTKKYLQGKAKAAYNQTGAFQTSEEAAKAARRGARQARKAEMKLAPETKEANLKLVKIRELEKVMNKNLVTPDKPEAAILAAGSGSNRRNQANLKRIMKLTGYDALGDAEKLSSARYFADPELLPVDTTGKSVARMSLAGVLSGMIGGPATGVAMVALSSPVVLKRAIQVGVLSKKGVEKVLSGAFPGTKMSVDKISSKTIDALKSALETPEGAMAFKAAIVGTSAGIGPEDKKRMKFEKQGISRIMESTGDTDYANLMDNLDDKKMRGLLKKASTQKPGSVGLQNTIKQIEKRRGELNE